MRTLKLTHEEIRILVRALGIAESKFYELRKEYFDSVINVRGTEPDKMDLSKETDIMFSKANEFADLLIAIENSDKDV